MFIRIPGLFRGVFETFDEARQSAPSVMPVGFNYPEYARHHLDRLERVHAYDYPVMLWLKDLLTADSSIFDFGGNVGIHYHAYRRYLAYPAGLRWIVCDLPELTALGIEVGAARGNDGLVFVNDFTGANRCDIFISAGTLQYVEEPLGSLLSQLEMRPRHLLLNKLPLYGGPTFVTLQNGGVVFAPQYVLNRALFLQSLDSLGYLLIDEWEVPGFSCYVPFHANRSVATYSGMYLRLDR